MQQRKMKQMKSSGNQMGGTSFLSMMESRMPPGFRFHPRDEELIGHYLAKKLSGSDPLSSPLLVNVDLNKVEPWDLPGEACVGGKEWYFYSLRDRKYATGQRTNRATLSGYWKATGKDRSVHDSKRGGKLVGMRKTLVFYQGRAPKGKKTDWVMHEFRLESSSSSSSSLSSLPSTMGDNHSKGSSTPPPSKEDWVLCRVFYKSKGVLSLKPNVNILPSAMVSQSCYHDDDVDAAAADDDDDMTSSSLPPLMDSSSTTAAFINFEQQPDHITSTTTQGLLYTTSHTHDHQQHHHQQQQQQQRQQVPCFSSSPRLQLPPFRHRLQLPLDTSGMMPPIMQLVTLPDLNPLIATGFSNNDNHGSQNMLLGTTGNDTLLSHHLTKMENQVVDDHDDDEEEQRSHNHVPPQEGSSEQSFLTDIGPPGQGNIWSSY